MVGTFSLRYLKASSFEQTLILNIGDQAFAWVMLESLPKIRGKCAQKKQIDFNYARCRCTQRC